MCLCAFVCVCVEREGGGGMREGQCGTSSGTKFGNSFFVRWAGSQCEIVTIWMLDNVFVYMHVCGGVRVTEKTTLSHGKCREVPCAQFINDGGSTAKLL